MSKSVPISIRVSEETDSRLSAVERLLDVNRSVAVRMAIEAIHNSLLVDSPEVAFSGNKEMVEKKWDIVRSTREHKGLAMAARQAGVTRATVETWLEYDALFAQFVQEAWDESIELADHRLWHLGVNDNQIKGLFGTLNAHHPDHGLIRREFIDSRVRSVIEKDFLPLVQARLSRDALESFERELSAKFGLILSPRPEAGQLRGESGD